VFPRTVTLAAGGFLCERSNRNTIAPGTNARLHAIQRTLSRSPIEAGTDQVDVPTRVDLHENKLTRE
jgi:hypothetical protein